MFQLTAPELLFDKQKVYRVKAGVDKAFLEERNFRLVVVYESAESELAAPLKEMLGKLIGACKFKTEETLYLNISAQPASFADIQNQFNPEAILIFGDYKPGRNMNELAKNHPYQFDNLKILCTDKAEIIEANKKGEKVVLWAALQSMFNLK